MANRQIKSAQAAQSTFDQRKHAGGAVSFPDGLPMSKLDGALNEILAELNELRNEVIRLDTATVPVRNAVPTGGGTNEPSPAPDSCPLVETLLSLRRDLGGIIDQLANIRSTLAV